MKIAEDARPLLKLTPNTKELLRALDRRRMPAFSFDDCAKDIEHLFATIAQPYVDSSCVHLHLDELVGEAYLKFSRKLSAGYFERCGTRVEFFAMLKTIVNNHIKGLVQKYRFTIKRTGTKPPPKGQIPLSFEDFRSSKPVEISLNDPDSLLQVSEPEAPMALDDDLEVEIKHRLTPIEALVFDQLVSPNSTALFLAESDSVRGRESDQKTDSIRINVKKSHLAEGIGLDEQTFQTIEKAVKGKVEEYLSMENDRSLSREDLDFNAAFNHLKTAFSVQLPRSLKKIDIKRGFTLLARRNFDGLTDEVKKSLKIVGARVPESNGMSLTCFGVLYSGNNRICSMCGLKESCLEEAATMDLDKIVPSPQILGVRQMRIPTLVTDMAPVTPQPNERNDGIMAYLNETFASSLINRDTYYRHRESADGRRPPQIFCLVTSVPSENIQLRFCNPGEDLQPKLDKRRNGWYLPDSSPLELALELIEAHSSQVIDTEPEKVSGDTQ